MKNFSFVLSALFVASLLTACGGGFDFTVEDKTPKNPKPTTPTNPPAPLPPAPVPPAPVPTGKPVSINCQLFLNFVGVTKNFKGTVFLFNGPDSLVAPLASALTNVRNDCIQQAGTFGENDAFCAAIDPSNVVSFGAEVNLGSNHKFTCFLF